MERIIGALEKGIITILRLYQFFISPLLGNRCRFYPGCSDYAQTAILRFGILKGVFLTICRVVRCHPWHVGGDDPVPHRCNDQ